MDDLGAALREAGGVDAPLTRHARLSQLLKAELARGALEFTHKHVGYDRPITVAIAQVDDELRAVVPVPVGLRADPNAATKLGFLTAAAAVGALVLAGSDEGAPAEPLRVGDLDGFLVLSRAGGDAELAVVAFDESAAGVDRLRARALLVPPALLRDVHDLRPPIGPTHPLRVAEAVAEAGGDPADAASVAEHEEVVLAALTAGSDGGAPHVTRPHDDPDPARRAARRILQRLNGMGKWGGYHTEFVHLQRGFAGHERALVEEVGEALLAAGLLEEKPSVGQRHVNLNPGRKADIDALIERGEVPRGLDLG